MHALQKDQDINLVTEKRISDCCAVNYKKTPVKSEKSNQKLEDIYTDIFENHYERLFSILTNDDITELSDEMKKSAVSAVISIFGRNTSWKDLIHHLNTQSKKDFRLNKLFRIDHYFDARGMRVNIRNKTLEELQINEKNISRIPLVVTPVSYTHLDVYKRQDADPTKPAPTPERLYDAEAGYTYNNSHVSLSANAYYMYYHNQLVLTGCLLYTSRCV